MGLPKKGDIVLVRSNTRDDYLGEVVSVDGLFVTLTNASWIGDSGRFGAFMRNGLQSNPATESEFIGEWTTSISGWGYWNHDLPKGDRPS